jgi:hypothetical protein
LWRVWAIYSVEDVRHNRRLHEWRPLDAVVAGGYCKRLDAVLDD